MYEKALSKVSKTADGLSVALSVPPDSKRVMASLSATKFSRSVDSRAEKKIAGFPSTKWVMSEVLPTRRRP